VAGIVGKGNSGKDEMIKITRNVRMIAYLNDPAPYYIEEIEEPHQ
jgi:hypothetical protein